MQKITDMEELFKYTQDKENFTTIITFYGRMDTIATEKVNSALPASSEITNVDQAWKLKFDLAEVDYIASSFIRICVSHAKMAGPGNFSIMNCQPFVKKTFKITGLDDLLNII